MKRLMYALILLGIGVFPSVSLADDFDIEKHPDGEVLVGLGALLNNTRVGDGEYIDFTVRRSNVIRDLEGQVTFTHVERSNFGYHHGSEQIVTAGLNRRLDFGNNGDVRIGGGLLVAVHYAWGNYLPEGMKKGGTYKAECLWCGWYTQVSYGAPPIDIDGLRWVDRCEVTYRYVSTDPNFWTSHNGGLAQISCNVLDWGNKGDSLFGEARKPDLPTPRKQPLPVEHTLVEVVQAPIPSATCSPSQQLEADNSASRRMTGPI